MFQWVSEFEEMIQRFGMFLASDEYWRRRYLVNCAEKGGVQQGGFVRSEDFVGKMRKQQPIYGGKRWKRKMI